MNVSLVSGLRRFILLELSCYHGIPHMNCGTRYYLLLFLCFIHDKLLCIFRL